MPGRDDCKINPLLDAVREFLMARSWEKDRQQNAREKLADVYLEVSRFKCTPTNLPDDTVKAIAALRSCRTVSYNDLPETEKYSAQVQVFDVELVRKALALLVPPADRCPNIHCVNGKIPTYGGSPEYYPICPTCEGTGKKKPCERCSGTGWLLIADLGKQVCPDCGATGMKL